MRFNIFVIYFCIINASTADTDFCEIDKTICEQNKNKFNRYILYDVNQLEGFNIRRDVYLRFAIFLHNLQNKNNFLNFKLVLPPWPNLKHWTNNNSSIPWSFFFDLKNLQLFAPVIEMHQFFIEIGEKYKKIKINEVYILRRCLEMYKTHKYKDKIAIEPCEKYFMDKADFVDFFQYSNITSNNIECLSFHGNTSQLVNILQKSKSRTFLFHRSEIAIHETNGDNKIYWQGRRSMRFNKKLINAAKKFREKYLNSTDENDNTVLPDDWRDEKPRRNAKGGPYLSVHLRRRDFLEVRPSQVPFLKNASSQIIKLLEELNLDTVFIATDAPPNEFKKLKKKFPEKYKIVKFSPSKETLNKFKDGGVAIIDQIICSHAQYFIGTRKSTFSDRIYEEREISGFPSENTFNCLCGRRKCEKPSDMWKIVY